MHAGMQFGSLLFEREQYLEWRSIFHLRSSPLQQDIPRDSLKYHYGPLDPLNQHGGYASVTLTPLTMDVTYYDASGMANMHIY